MSANITLYHATWCGHCISFLPEWEKIKKEKSDKISFNEYESEEVEAKNATIDGKPLQGFPSIKITFKDSNGKNTKEIDYVGKRRKEEILDFVKQKIG